MFNEPPRKRIGGMGEDADARGCTQIGADSLPNQISVVHESHAKVPSRQDKAESLRVRYNREVLNLRQSVCVMKICVPSPPGPRAGRLRFGTVDRLRGAGYNGDVQ